MIELKQFLLWMLRKLSKLPRKWFNQLTDTYQCSDWPIPIIILTFVLGSGSILFAWLVTKIFNIEVGSIVLVVLWIVFGGFIVSAGIRAMYRAFKQEQNEFIRQLKS